MSIVTTGSSVKVIALDNEENIVNIPISRGQIILASSGKGWFDIESNHRVEITGGGGEDIDDHIRDKNNPHSVTKEQVGLGQVENKSIEDQHPTYTPASSLQELQSNEPLSSAFAKIAKSIKDLISHLEATNPHNITPTMINAADKSHNHSADEISSGVIPVSRGGTEVTSYEDLASKVSPFLSSHSVCGFYEGDETASRKINIGFIPDYVIIISQGYTSEHPKDVIATVRGYAVINGQSSRWEPEQQWSDQRGVLMIPDKQDSDEKGFVVNYNRDSPSIITNSIMWMYIAGKCTEIQIPSI